MANEWVAEEYRSVHKGLNGEALPQAGDNLTGPSSGNDPKRMEPNGRQGNTTPPVLTRRELEVLALLARGMPNRDIGATLYITERTVKYHVSGLLRKLNAGNRTEAVIMARKLGFLE
ncbi:MAG: response regulator transcription factor [Chloroflexi bacterium]|nr:response regulator transcription factor [Chloroflexota bacterium]